MSRRNWSNINVSRFANYRSNVNREVDSRHLREEEPYIMYLHLRTLAPLRELHSVKLLTIPTVSCFACCECSLSCRLSAAVIRLHSDPYCRLASSDIESSSQCLPDTACLRLHIGEMCRWFEMFFVMSCRHVDIDAFREVCMHMCHDLV